MVALVALGLLILGVAIGWWIGASGDSRRTANPQPTVTVEVPAIRKADEALMPDLRGIDQQGAMEILGDVEIDVSTVEVTTAAAAGQSGVVFSQSPAAGSSINGRVSIVVSAPARVPDLSQVKVDDAQRQLSVLGAESVIERVYRAGSSPGEILAVAPETGKPLPSRVKLTVADAPSSVYLSTVNAIEGGCSSGSRELNGTDYDTSVSCQAAPDGRSTVWLTSRVADALTATVGVPDDGDPGARVTVVVMADGKKVKSMSAAYGRPAELDIKLAGVLRLAITATATGADVATTAVLGNARLIGGPGLADKLGESP